MEANQPGFRRYFFENEKGYAFIEGATRRMRWSRAAQSPWCTAESVSARP